MTVQVDKDWTPESIRAFRRAKRWTQAQLAERLGVTRQQVNGWEKGRMLPSLSSLMRLDEIAGR